MSFKVFDREVVLRPVCECRIREREKREEQARLEKLHRTMRLQGLEEGRYARMSLDGWECRDGRSVEVARKLDSYLGTVSLSARNWLYLFGDYGLGKTHLGVSSLRYLCLKHGWEPLLVRWSEFCSRIQQSWQSSDAGSEYDLWRKAANVTFLVLDDIDKRASSEWALGKLFELIDHRYMRQLPTVLIANRDIKKLSSYWGKNDKNDKNAKNEQMQDLAGAIVSRVLGQLSAAIEFSGQDYRLEDS
jgi:DNA replication protein DnaC